MFTVYGRPGTGAASVEALCDEMGLLWQYETVKKDADGNNPPAFLKEINPLGQVPALRCPDGTIITESAAIMIYLADLKPGFAPAPHAAIRARYLRLMVLLAASTYPADLRYLYADRYTTKPEEIAGISAAAAIELERDYDILAAELGGKPYFLGDVFSALDLYAGMIVTWAPDVKALFARHPNLAAHYARIKARPATAAAWARNNMMDY